MCYILRVAQSILFQHVCFSYPHQQKTALCDVDLTISQGEVFALLGPNGAGKTTLLRLLCGRLPGYTGTLVLPDFWQSEGGRLDARKMGILIENPGIYPRLSVREYLRFFGGFYTIADLDARIQKLVQRMELSHLDQRMSALSLGMRQKVQIIRALLHRPPLVLLDEPSGNLDPMAREAVWDLVQESNRKFGTTFIICSHLLPEMEAHCSRMGFLRQGTLLASGSLDELGRGHLCRVRVYSTENLPEDLLSGMTGLENAAISGQMLEFQTEAPQRVNPQVVAFLVGKGFPVVEVNICRPGLADLYRHYMSEGG
ncbi:MAG TPA: ABC transporter ATP-binding protein [Fibrobacteraceae bacterium]|nr:ABC transporter ATP-binding protein [Fibrobacteraceae bacterium]